MTTTLERRSAVHDSEHAGDIRGALGTIRLDDASPRRGRSAQLKTLLAIIGPGLIVMIGDNDAGAFATYGQAGQNYGTRLLWTLLLLVPVLYVNQEMVLRLGAVTGVGHARLILERFGKFWGAFSVIDLFLLNALTIVTEFIGVSLAASYLGLPKIAAVALAALVIIGAAFTGSFRRFERIAIGLCAGSLLLIPVYFLSHPAAGQMVRGYIQPTIPGGSGQLAAVMLLVIGIVGTTVAPWQLFFQQSYVIDKRITPRFIRYEKADLWIGIVIVVLGAGAIMGFTAAAFAGHAGGFTDAAGVARGLEAHAGRLAGVLFAIALLDASIIGAFAVSLSTAYALGDVFGLKHSLHRGVKGAKGFYAVYGSLIIAAATIVLIPGSPRAPDQHLHHGRGRRPGRAVGHPDHLGAVPGDHRRADPRHLGRLRRDRAGSGRVRRRLPAARRDPGRGPDRPHRPGQLADAATGPADPPAGAVAAQGRDDGAAALPGHGHGPGHRQDRSAGHRALTGARVGHDASPRCASGGSAASRRRQSSGRVASSTSSTVMTPIIWRRSSTTGMVMRL